MKSLRSLRGLRPLRMISRNQGMRLVLNALMAAIPAMTNVLLVCMLILLIFAIMGVTFFKGKFYNCTGLTEELLLDVNDINDCNNFGGKWENLVTNFDNVMNAMLVLFQMMTTEGWMIVMYAGIDARGVDL